MSLQSYQEEVERVAQFIWNGNPEGLNAPVNIGSAADILAIAHGMDSVEVAGDIQASMAQIRQEPKQEIEERQLFLVEWSKTYVASGRRIVRALGPNDAAEIADDLIGDWEGSMEYDPDQNEISVEDLDTNSPYGEEMLRTWGVEND